MKMVAPKGGTIPLSRNLSLIVWRVLTRETIQNSLDAKLDENTPVYVDFVESNIPSDQIPNLDALKEILTLCEKETKHQNIDMIKELSLAKQTANCPRIPILSIADYNTRGMK